MKKYIKEKYYTKKKEKKVKKNEFNPTDSPEPLPEKEYKTTDPDELAFLKRLEKKKQDGSLNPRNPNAKQDFDNVLKEMLKIHPKDWPEKL